MPRNKSYNRDELIGTAMQQFWHGGFEATSMDDLVRCTGVSRHGIYTEFGGKQNLFDTCLLNYREQVVTPAFAGVEAPMADLDAVVAYFDYQLTRAGQAGLPGPGCMMVNTMAELTSCKGEANTIVQAHNQRLTNGFANVIKNSSQRDWPADELSSLARTVMIFANGLWSVSRSVNSIAPLRQAVAVFLQTLKMRMMA